MSLCVWSCEKEASVRGLCRPISVCVEFFFFFFFFPSLHQIHLPLHLTKWQILLRDNRYRVKMEKSNVLFSRISKRPSGSIGSSYAPKPSDAWFHEFPETLGPVEANAL